MERCSPSLVSGCSWACLRRWDSPIEGSASKGICVFWHELLCTYRPDCVCEPMPILTSPGPWSWNAWPASEQKRPNHMTCRQTNDGVREVFLEEVACRLDLENRILKSRGKWEFIASRGFSLKKGRGRNKELGVKEKNMSEEEIFGVLGFL